MILGYPRPKATSRSLQEWLEVATAGLTASAREKIEREIGAHYLDAVEAHRTKGETDETAQASALAELGSPGAAWERFREQYLTEADMACMRQAHATALRPWNNTSALVSLILFFFIFVTDLTVTSRPEGLLDSYFARHNEFKMALVSVAFLMACVLTPAMSYRLAKRSSVELAARTLLNWEVARYFFISATAMFLWAWIRPLRESVFIFGLLCMRPRQDVLRKLGKKAKPDTAGPLAS